jgi:hypothetical protein
VSPKADPTIRETLAALDTGRPLAVDPLDALREPFPQNRVGLLPKPLSKDARKGECPECGKWHGLPAIHLDFVGHGAVTERLLEVDPGWTWEPFALDAVGLPALDRYGNLWIRLTVAGVTRIGVGDGPNMKEIIGDALRNAAMRFGVALDLWIRGQEDDPAEHGQALPAVRPTADELVRPLIDTYGAEHAAAVALLIEEMNGWPEEVRAERKRAFVAEWGPVTDLMPGDLAAARDWVADRSAEDSPPDDGSGYG